MTNRPGLLASVSQQALSTATAQSLTTIAAAQAAQASACATTAQNALAALQAQQSGRSGFAAAGVPSGGLGCYDFPGRAEYPTFYDNFVANTGISPYSHLLFTGDFYSTSNILSNINTALAKWFAEPRINGTAYGRTAPIVPTAGFILWSESGDITFAKMFSGQLDTYLHAYVQAFKDHGFLKVEVRIGYEINFPTTPDGQGSDRGAFPGTMPRQGSAYDRAIYMRDWVRAFRYAAYHLVQFGAAIGVTVVPIWNPVTINENADDISPFDYYPDDHQYMDGYGLVVGYRSLDFYSGNIYSPFSAELALFDGYEHQAPYTTPVQTGTAPDLPTWAQSRGSKWAAWDYYDGHTGAVGPGNWGPGVSFRSFFAHNQICAGGPRPFSVCEYGALTAYDGGLNEGLTVQDPTAFSYNPPNYPGLDPDMAPYLRSRMAYEQARGVDFVGLNMWQNQAPAMMRSQGSTWPELQTVFTGPRVSQITPPSAALGVTFIPSMVVGQATTIPCWWTGTQPTAIDVSLDGGTTWSAATSPVISANRNVTISVTVLIANAAQTISIRDHNAQTVRGTSNTFPAIVVTPAGTPAGSTTANTGPTLTLPGAVYAAGGFNGLQGLTSLTASATATLTDPGGDKSWTWHFKAAPPASGNGSYMGAFVVQLPSSGQTGMFVDPTGTLAMTAAGVGIPGPVVADNIDHWIGLSQSGTTAQMLLDGVVIASATVAAIPANATFRIDSPSGIAVVSQAVISQGCRYPIAPLGTTVAQVPTQPAGTGDPNVLAIFRLNGS